MVHKGRDDAMFGCMRISDDEFSEFYIGKVVGLLIVFYTICCNYFLMSLEF